MTEQVTLPATPLTVRRARQYVADTVVGMGLGRLRTTAELLTSELVTNALVHAGTEISLSISRSGDRLRVEVGDGGAMIPASAPPGHDGENGRGLQLIDAVATDWGVDPAEGGKLIWFELSAAVEPALSADFEPEEQV